MAKSRPYLAVELDAIEQCPLVGAACEMSAGDVSWGLLQTWRHCWRHEVDVVSDVQVGAFFGLAEAGRISGALAAFGFIERVETGWRVRGVERYLKLKTAQRDNGKAGAKNLKQHRRLRSEPPEGDRKASGTHTGVAPALSASNEQLATNSEQLSIPRAKKPRGSDSPPTGDHAVAIERTTADFQRLKGVKYGFTGRDAKAVKELLAFATPDEISTRWCRAIQSPGYPSVATLSELKTHWNHFAAAKVIDITKGVAPVGDFSHLAIGESRRLDGTF